MNGTDAERRRWWKITIALVSFAVYQVALGLFVSLAFISIEDQRQDDCDSALAIREDSMQNDRRAFTELGHELGASESQIEEFIARIEAGYEELPEPTQCQ